MKALAWACAFAASFASAGTALAAKAHSAPAPRPAEFKLPKDLPPPDPALFRIANGQSTVYLLGSIHILPANYSWHSPAIDEAINSADAFMFEANLDYATAEFDYYRDRHGYLPSGHTIHEMLSADGLKKYNALIDKFHIDRNKIDYLQPGLAVFLLNSVHMSAHPDFVPGVDASLVHYAKQHGKRLGYLETLESGFAMITKVGGGTQVKVLEKALADADDNNGKLQKMLLAWTSGDLVALRAMDDIDDPEARTLLLDKRNQAWLPRIMSMLDVPQTTLITVGAMHLAGQGSVIELLCAKGVKVDRIKAGVAASACEAEPPRQVSAASP